MKSNVVVHEILTSIRKKARRLAKSVSVLHQNAAVHHHENSGLACLGGCFFVNHSLLHPYRRGFDGNRLYPQLLQQTLSDEICSLRYLFLQKPQEAMRRIFRRALH